MPEKLNKFGRDWHSSVPIPHVNLETHNAKYMEAYAAAVKQNEQYAGLSPQLEKDEEQSESLLRETGTHFPESPLKDGDVPDYFECELNNTISEDSIRRFSTSLFSEVTESTEAQIMTPTCSQELEGDAMPQTGQVPERPGSVLDIVGNAAPSWHWVDFGESTEEAQEEEQKQKMKYSRRDADSSVVILDSVFLVKPNPLEFFTTGQVFIVKWPASAASFRRKYQTTNPPPYLKFFNQDELPLVVVDDGRLFKDASLFRSYKTLHGSQPGASQA
ncbi:hypothetical protein M432DRAFT_639214 [Thermoascus aurantiacus ATCC 26904]